ncbi:hypothetical protein SLEP1_g52724 [Rubroshorea leprosula]|uniref:Uncharacterized protein n=1 Tax=Rubroshorea leprosula TaxID=152421 RepID=A0AAV5M758_9ROSI|nr:hypothetical protein SLEP1_g52724 [Rubroshorea leprosula]
MATEKKPRRPPCRRQKYHGAPIGVNFRQHLLQRAINTTTLWPVRAATAVMEEKMKRVKKSNEKKRVELKRLTLIRLTKAVKIGRLTSKSCKDLNLVRETESRDATSYC